MRIEDARVGMRVRVRKQYVEMLDIETEVNRHQPTGVIKAVHTKDESVAYPLLAIWNSAYPIEVAWDGVDYDTEENRDPVTGEQFWSPTKVVEIEEEA